MASGARTAVAFAAQELAARIAPVAAAINRWPELDCLRNHFSRERLARAEQRAADIGVGADRVLIAAGALSEEAYLRGFAENLGASFEPLDGVPRRLCPLDDTWLIEAAKVGVLPLAENGRIILVVAPRGLAARTIAQAVQRDPALAARFRFTTAARLNRFVLRYAGEQLAEQAADALRQRWPRLSAAPPRQRGLAVALVITIGAALLAMGFDAVTATTIGRASAITLATLFLAWLALRIAAAAIAPEQPAISAPLSEHELPVYTVICALYREAASIGELLAAIGRLDYPREKLDVVIALEQDDEETRAAIEARNNRVPLSLITVPAAGPRTKPKALNAALPFAHGSFTVIYDAEDRPEPDQLRRALQAFERGGDDLACVQARLTIDNTADGWLARLFTAEYAGQFDVFLPGLAAMGLPLPLGGSSNHFRTATLREVGGWDAYNVTEDADLGMRLARFGYRAGMIASTTSEEAPARLGAWLRQRTRWFKGWMQTWLVHMRAPHRLLRDLGLPGFLAFQLIVGGNVLAALVHPLFLAALIYAGFDGAPPWRGDMATETLAVLYAATALAGYLVSGLLGWMGLARRRLRSSAWVLLLMPLHWLLLSLAAWRALYQLVRKPYAWEKTAHGLARSSRLARDMTRALIELERHLTHLQETGQLPSLANKRNASARRWRRGARDTSSTPRPPLRAGA
jgi:cellulose synthase/poly-beta-1,6-N-acetylglucosamine synthase-like glycosyltransferase